MGSRYYGDYSLPYEPILLHNWTDSPTGFDVLFQFSEVIY
jgi:hypothetical protein